MLEGASEQVDEPMDARPSQPSWHLKVPPPIWGMAMLILAFIVDRYFGTPFVFRSTPLAVLIGAGGLLLAGWGERTFAAEGTDILPASPTNKKLVTRGPFRYTRNPMYSGLVLMATGFALYFGTVVFYVVPVLLFLLCNFSFIPFEEAKMQRQFGDQYTDYLNQVRRWV
jgi:protein-S-isoprenylcysteine O-methyltransferase Ste14